jgi:hypothetical protein
VRMELVSRANVGAATSADTPIRARHSKLFLTFDSLLN